MWNQFGRTVLIVALLVALITSWLPAKANADEFHEGVRAPDEAQSSTCTVTDRASGVQAQFTLRLSDPSAFPIAAPDSSSVCQNLRDQLDNTYGQAKSLIGDLLWAEGDKVCTKIVKSVGGDDGLGLALLCGFISVAADHASGGLVQFDPRLNDPPYAMDDASVSCQGLLPSDSSDTVTYDVVIAGNQGPGSTLVGSGFCQVIQSNPLAASLPPTGAFGPISFGSGWDHNRGLLGVTTNFPSGTTRLYFSFDYQGVTNGLPCNLTLLFNGNPLADWPYSWQDGADGSWLREYSNYRGLPDGVYQLVVSVKGREVERATFTVGDQIVPG